MRILYLHKFNLDVGWGGSATVLRALHGVLTEMGHQVEVVSAKCPDRFGFSVCGLPFPVSLTFGPEKRPGETAIDEIPNDQLSSLAEAAAEKIEREVFSPGLPDLILANHINLMTLVAWRLAARHSIPFRIIAYGTDTQLLERDERFLRLFGPPASHADKILCISSLVARKAEELVGGRVEAMGGAVDGKLFCSQEAYGLGDGTLIFSGRLVTEKGLWPLLAAFARQRASPLLKIVGEGPLYGELAGHVAGNDLRTKVELLGYVNPDRLGAVLVPCSVAVVPSLWEEPLGLVVLEAMACGLPVLASAVGGIPEMIRHGENGLLLPPGDVHAWASAIDKVLGDRALLARMRQAVRDTPIRTYRDLARQVLA
jgi:glycosyltransferase involved in cell wall biosynthesis